MPDDFPIIFAMGEQQFQDIIEGLPLVCMLDLTSLAWVTREDN